MKGNIVNWKKRVTTVAAVGCAAVIATATSAFAEGPHYSSHGGVVKPPSGGAFCTYNWFTADSTGYPSWKGKHVWMAYYGIGSGALENTGCQAHVMISYLNNAGAIIHKYGAKDPYNGGFDTEIAAEYYKKVYYAKFYVTDKSSGKIITGSTLEVSPNGTVLAKS